MLQRFRDLRRVQHRLMDRRTFCRTKIRRLRPLLRTLLWSLRFRATRLFAIVTLLTLFAVLPMLTPAMRFMLLVTAAMFLRTRRWLGRFRAAKFRIPFLRPLRRALFRGRFLAGFRSAFGRRFRRGESLTLRAHRFFRMRLAETARRIAFGFGRVQMLRRRVLGRRNSGCHFGGSGFGGSRARSAATSATPAATASAAASSGTRCASRRGRWI